MENFLKSNLIYQISIACAIFLPVLLIVRVYWVIRLKEYTRKNYIHITSYIVVLLLIFTLVFTDYERTFFGVFLSLMVILASLIILIQKVFR